MYFPEAAGGGRGRGRGEGLPQLNNTGDGGWTYSKALNDWFTNTVKVGNNTNFAAGSAAASPDHIVSGTGATEEVRHYRVDSLPCGSNSTYATRAVSAAEVVQEQQQPLGKKAKAIGRVRTNNRWENHKKATCKCAVCRQCRGELKSSWFKHNLANCACAVCRQIRGETKPREPVGGGPLCGKDCTPSMPSKRASWLPLREPSVECRSCSKETPLQLQKESPSHLATPPVRPETCTMTGIPIPWQKKLANLAKGRTDYSSVRGIPPNSSPFRDPKWESEETCERLACHKRPGCSYHLENMDAEQQGFHTNLFSNSRCSGWPNADRAFSANFAESKSDGVHHCTSDCVNMRRNCQHPAVSSYNGGPGLSWQNSLNRRQDAAGTSTGLHNADSPGAKNLKLQLGHSWGSVKETSPVNERDGHWSTYPKLGNMSTNAAGALPDPFLSLGQSSSFFEGHSSPMADVQPDAASRSTIFPELDCKPVYIPFQSSNSPPTLSHRSPSVAQFPFGLEVQAEAQCEIYQPVCDLEAPIHTQSMSFNFDEGTTESSSPPCETTSTTSVLNEKENFSPVMDVDSGDILRSSSAILQGSLEKEMTLTDGDAWAQARDQLLQSRGDKEGRPGSKRLANPDDSHFTVHQKRGKRETVSHAVPKWCRLIHSKSDYLTITRKIFIRSRVRKRCPESSLSEALEPCDNMEGRSRSEESIANSNLQSTGPAGVRESTNMKGAPGAVIPARREAFVAPEANIADLPESMLNLECKRESLNSTKCLETSPETETEDSPRDMKIRKLNCYGKMPERLGLQCAASVIRCRNNILDDSEAREVEMPRSRSESPDCKINTLMVDLSNILRKIEESDICAIDDQLGNTVQPADPLIQNFLTKVSHGSQGRKRLSPRVEICSELRQTRLDPLGHLIPQSKHHQYVLQPLKKRCTDQGPSVGMSALCTDVEPALKVDHARTFKFNRKTVKLTVEVLLPEALKVYYLMRILKARTPALTVWSTDLVRYMAHQSPSILMVHSHALVPKEHASLCPGPLYLLRRALKKDVCPKTAGLVTGPKVLSETRVYLPSDIEEGTESSSENMIVGTRPKMDEELLSRFWHVLCAESGFRLLPHGRVTIYAEDFLRHRPFDGKIDCAPRSLSTLRKYCVYSLLCDIGAIVNLGGTKFKQAKMTAFEMHQPLIDEKLIPLRNLLFPSWVDKPFHCSVRLIFPGILLRRSPPRLLSSSDAADVCITSREQDLTGKGHCKQPTENSTGAKLEDDLNAERMQIYSDGSLREGYTSSPVNIVQTSVYNLMEAEQTPGSSAFHGDCSITSREQGRTGESHCKQPTENSIGTKLEDDLNAERMQIYSDGVLAEGYTSSPVNVVQTRVYNLMEREQTPGSSAFHGDCSTSIESRSLQTPCTNSFQDLLNSIIQTDKNASLLFYNSESRIDSREKRQEISSSECSRSVRDSDIWESHSDLRNDGPTSPALTSACDSMSTSFRKRGCPKGGWPRKASAANKYTLRSVCQNDTAGEPASSTTGTKARGGLTKMAEAEDLSPAAPVDRDNTTSQHTADGETDIEVRCGLTEYSLRSVSRNDTAVEPASSTTATKARAGLTKTAEAEDLSPAAPVDRDNTTSQHIADGETDIEVRGGLPKFSLRSVCRNDTAVEPASSTTETKARGGLAKMAEAEDLSPAAPVDRDNTTSQHIADGETDIEVRGGLTKMAEAEDLSPASPLDRDNTTSQHIADGETDVEVRGGLTKMAEAEDLSPAPPVDRDNTASQHIADGETDIEVIHPTNISSSKRLDNEFKKKLKTFLDKPFQLQELRELEGQALLRKPLLRLRETRHRVLHVATRKKGMSYLDHHPDLARKVADAAAPEERLRLLRGFFFWLQHSCTSGSFKPWAPDVEEVEEVDDECVEISKERFGNNGHHVAPEAKATVEPTGSQHDQTNVGEKNTTQLTPTGRGCKRKCASQPSKSKHFCKEIKPSMDAKVKKERK